MTRIIDFEHERAQRVGVWTRWADRQPKNHLVIRLRSPVLDGPCDGKYVRRSSALCEIEADGSLRLVRPPYDDLEWMPG